MPKLIDPVALAETERLLSQPIPVELRDIPEYTGPHSGLVNGLICAATRIARGAVADGIGLARAVLDGAVTS